MVNGTLSASGFPLVSEKNTSNCLNVTAGTGGTIGLFGSNFNLSSNSKLLAEGGYYCGIYKVFFFYLIHIEFKEMDLVGLGVEWLSQ